MTVGIVGLGLIGGSLAKAYHQSGHTVLAYDEDPSVQAFAAISGAIDGALSQETIAACDLIFIAVYPQATIAYLEKMGPFIGTHPVVMDCCGTKRMVCAAGSRLAKQYSFTFIGGHPMAGTQYSGFKYASEDMFQGAPMVIVPPSYDDIVLLSRVKKLLEPAGFGSISVTTAEKHDEMIAFTSQLAHVVSNAYIKSPTAEIHKGFSAGSYKDMTRVAWLNPEMWAELFLENKDFLVRELDQLMEHLQVYKDAMQADDQEGLTKLLAEGKKRKEEVDGI